jgi:glycosyltransferase involved in cell wall biosynthesis
MTRARPTLISVVLPVRDAAATLPDQLTALARQTYRGPWELLVCDNGSRDRTADLLATWTARVPELRVIDASARTGLNHARNAGVAAARGDFVVFCDGDDVVSPGWLDALARRAPDSDIVAGVLERAQLNPWETSHDGGADPLAVKHDYLAGLPGGNCGMWTSVARDVGWDERFTFAGSDTEFSWRAQLAGYRIEVAPEAVLHVRQRRGLRALAAQWYRYGAAGPKLYRVFREHGMPGSGVGAGVRAWASIGVHVFDLARGRAARRRWVRLAASRVGRLAGSIRSRVIYL